MSLFGRCRAVEYRKRGEIVEEVVKCTIANVLLIYRFDEQILSVFRSSPTRTLSERIIEVPMSLMVCMYVQKQIVLYDVESVKMPKRRDGMIVIACCSPDQRELLITRTGCRVRANRDSNAQQTTW